MCRSPRSTSSRHCFPKAAHAEFSRASALSSIPLAAIVNYIYQTRIVNRLRKRRENNELQRSILKAKESERDKSMKA